MRRIRFALLAALALFAANAVAADRTTYFVPDALGSPVAAMDDQGNVLWHETYAPYGQRQTKSAANNASPAYTGKPEDPDTGLVYMGARMYDPETARFTGMDPQGFKEGNPQTFGRYVYANNSPYRYVDPNGESIIEGSVFVALDIVEVGAAIAAHEPVGSAVADLGIDVIGAILPAPGAGPALKIARAADKASEANKVAKRVDNERGVIREFTQEKDQVYYRVFSGDAKQGSFLTAIPPKSSGWAQEALSLPPANKANLIQEVLVPAGTNMRRSRASPVPQWGRNRGGAEQFELRDRIPSENFGPGTPLK